MLSNKHGRGQNMANTKKTLSIWLICVIGLPWQHIGCKTSAFNKNYRLEGEHSRWTWVAPMIPQTVCHTQPPERERERALTTELAMTLLNIPKCWASRSFELPHMVWTACVWESWQVLDAARQMSLPFSLRGNVWEICHQFWTLISVEV